MYCLKQWLSLIIFRNRNEHAKKISLILDSLTDNKTYDKRLRPKYGAEPVNVGITIHVSSISAVSEVNMVS